MRAQGLSCPITRDLASLPRDRRDRPWTHVGRLWTNGEPFLAVDADHRAEWLGDLFDERIAGLGPDETRVAVGSAVGVLVGGDGVVRDDSWIEVLRADDGALAFVQASGPDYRAAVARALDFPGGGDLDGGVLRVGGGELAVFSTAVDGAAPLVAAAAGPVPADHGRPTGAADPGLLILARHRAYRLAVRWYTELPEGGCFARWLLRPGPGDS